MVVSWWLNHPSENIRQIGNPPQIVRLEIFPNRGENKQYLKPPSGGLDVDFWCLWNVGPRIKMNAKCVPKCQQPEQVYQIQVHRQRHFWAQTSGFKAHKELSELTWPAWMKLICTLYIYTVHIISGCSLLSIILSWESDEVIKLCTGTCSIDIRGDGSAGVGVQGQRPTVPEIWKVYLSANPCVFPSCQDLWHCHASAILAVSKGTCKPLRSERDQDVHHADRTLPEQSDAV